MVAHVCYPSTQEVEAELKNIPDHPQLYSVFKASVRDPVSEKIKNKKEKKKPLVKSDWGFQNDH